MMKRLFFCRLPIAQLIPWTIENIQSPTPAHNVFDKIPQWFRFFFCFTVLRLFYSSYFCIIFYSNIFSAFFLSNSGWLMPKMNQSIANIFSALLSVFFFLLLIGLVSRKKQNNKKKTECLSNINMQDIFLVFDQKKKKDSQANNNNRINKSSI